MRKNITSLLQRGNIRPKDRVKLLVIDMASKERDGKDLLTEADRYALSEGWTPKDNEEVKEYNRFNEGWKNVAYAEMDAQTIFLLAVNSFLRTSRYIDYIIQKKRYDLKDETTKNVFADIALDTIFKKYGDKKILNLVLGYLGLEFDFTIYLYAFELAGKELQKDLIALYPDIKTERDYLEQEEIIYNLFNGKDKLTQESKEKLAELIADNCFNRYTGKWSFRSYFTSIPLIELAKRIANETGLYKEIKGKTETDLDEKLASKLNTYAKKNEREIKDIVKEAVKKWLNEDLLDEYMPLFMSDEKATCNKQDTKLTHKEVFNKWLEVKAKATETIQGLIDKGELKTTKKTKTFEPLLKKMRKATGQTGQDAPKLKTETKTIITGESLYNLKGDYQFIKDIRSQVEDFKIFGALILFLRECSFVKDYSTLLSFELLFKELSKTFDTDLTYRIKEWISSFQFDLEYLRENFLMLADDILDKNYQSDRVYYMTESYLEELFSMSFNPNNIKPDMDGKVKIYYEKIKGQLQDDFKMPYYEKEK